MSPDSFFDGGKYNADLDAALRHALEMIRDGAEIIDVGGESTRPHATPVPAEIELKRVIPVIKLIRENNRDILISIDTMKPDVAEAAVHAGADIINDVSGLSDQRLLDVARETGAGLVLMHGYSRHSGKIDVPSQGDIASQIDAGIMCLIEQSLDNGICMHQICVDPGFGFGKKNGENLEVLYSIPLLAEKTQSPVLAGVSGKHFVESIYDKYDCSIPAEAQKDKLSASLRLAVAAYERGAKIFRVHNVLDTCTIFKNILKS